MTSSTLSHRVWAEVKIARRENVPVSVGKEASLAIIYFMAGGWAAANDSLVMKLEKRRDGRCCVHEMIQSAGYRFHGSFRQGTKMA